MSFSCGRSARDERVQVFLIRLPGNADVRSGCSSQYIYIYIYIHTYTHTHVHTYIFYIHIRGVTVHKIHGSVRYD